MSIQILPPQLANQIAAGEVVERPASVVKELVENALDAGATKIDIEIDKGGHKRILVRDNGKGVNKEQLSLALSRHATSKISTLDDLEAIVSLGFRGEALASISSVSRLTFTSKPAEQEQAWAAMAEGLDMQVELKPAAHPNGTSVEVLDLFFNTPARRKFLRAEKTEFSHIETLIKRIALSRPEVSFNLKHNGKWNKRLKAQALELDFIARQSGRIADVISPAFIDLSESCAIEYDDLKVAVWLKSPEHCASVNPAQYAFVNGRMMRDKLLQHAIRQAFAEQLNKEQQPEYVLYVELPAEDVDVNVHPAKHEVRFHQARTVHDLVVKVCLDALAQFQQQQEFGQEAPTNTQQSQEPQSQTQQQPAPDWLVLPQNTDVFDRANSAQSPSYKSQLRSAPRTSSAHLYSSKPSNSPKQQQMYNHFVEKAMASVKEAEVSVQSDTNPDEKPLEQSSGRSASELIPISENTEASGVSVFLLEQQRFVYLRWQQQTYLLDICQLDKFKTHGTNATTLNTLSQEQISATPLLVPVRMKLVDDEKSWWLKHAEELNSLGFDFKIHQQYSIVKQVPSLLRQKSNTMALASLFEDLMQNTEVTATTLLACLNKTSVTPTVEDISNYLTQLCDSGELRTVLELHAVLLNPAQLLSKH